jgi:hypothetical protein
MNLKEFLSSSAEAKAEFDALVGERAAAMATELAKEGVNGAVEAERGRILEIFSLSGAKISDEARKAVDTDMDAGEYAKARLKSLAGNLNASNGDVLGNPKPEPHRLAGEAGGLSLSEDEIRAIGKKAGGKR